MERPPRTHKMSPGGPYDEVTCDKCGEPATRAYEGDKFLNLCEKHYRDLGKWLEKSDEESLSDKLLDKKETFIEDKNLNEDQEEAVEDFVTWLTFRIDYGDEEI